MRARAVRQPPAARRFGVPPAGPDASGRSCPRHASAPRVGSIVETRLAEPSSASAVRSSRCSVARRSASLTVSLIVVVPSSARAAPSISSSKSMRCYHNGDITASRISNRIRHRNSIAPAALPSQTVALLLKDRETPSEAAAELPPTEAEVVAPDFACHACGAAMQAGQDWCLECGTAAPGRLGARPGWRAAFTVVSLTMLLVIGAVLASYAALTTDAERQASAPSAGDGAPIAAQGPGRRAARGADHARRDRAEHDRAAGRHDPRCDPGHDPRCDARRKARRHADHPDDAARAGHEHADHAHHAAGRDAARGPRPRRRPPARRAPRPSRRSSSSRPTPRRRTTRASAREPSSVPRRTRSTRARRPSGTSPCPPTASRSPPA